MITTNNGRMICVGFRRWKAANLKPMLSVAPDKVRFVRDAAAAESLFPQADDFLVVWGVELPEGIQALVQRTGARLARMEDGFVRSVGLGSDLIRPWSLVLDERGIYFDPTHPSDLEHILATGEFSAEELKRARKVREFIIEHDITKYNLEPLAKAEWPSSGKEVVLVPGQVEDDASIRFGCNDVKTNLVLLQAARLTHPDAFIVYKPHPDVMSGNRSGKLPSAREWADHIETKLSVVSCIKASDVIHTMTSLTGFDALLRGRQVVVYGQPFYAGWGITRDIMTDGAAFRRRTRCLTLDELVTGVLLRYPMYWDWDSGMYTTCEVVLQRIVENRNRLESDNGLEKLRNGFVRRQIRKIDTLARSFVRSA
jgi:capsular polysaccharide export protein